MTDWAYELADSLKLPLGTRNTEKIAAPMLLTPIISRAK